MKISQGVCWGACSTLMLWDLNGGHEGTEKSFIKELLQKLEFITSKEHFEEWMTLQEKYRENKIPNVIVIPPNYLGPSYTADQYAWLICSTNENQRGYQRWLKGLGFQSSEKNFNSKNNSCVTLFFIHPKTAMKNCREYLKNLNENSKG